MPGTEQTPLLSHSDLPPSPSRPLPSHVSSDQQPVSVPVPYLQLLPIFLIRIAGPLTYSLLFPFVIPYLEHLDVAPGQLGMYAGIAEGSLMIISAVTAPMWSSLADKYGRKKCVIYGWSFGTVASALVGFGKSGRKGVWWVIFWRGAAGVNPTGLLARVLIAEISHPTNRAKIFALYSPISSIGFMLGSLIGGSLAMPYGRLPWYLGGSNAFWKEWPCALPCLVGVAFSLVSLVICQILLEETRRPPPETPEDDSKDAVRKGSLELMKEILRLPGFGVKISLYAAMFALDGVFVICVLTSIEKGGLGFTSSIYGTFSAIFCLSFILISPFLSPYLQSRIGFRNTLTLITGIIPLEALMIPFGQFIARCTLHGGMGGGGAIARLVVLVIQEEAKYFHMMGWPMSDQLIVEALDNHPDLLATGSAMTSIVGTTCRAFSPGITG
ncbi:hypothetical protein I302_106299 [Kwoniella bestiolae CBS 10118]|uniref:Major facilitator superfamily (MFS) profile domain-containing protein n=1 Tax=Kwoniella bestiolae CBS 10118 TaxID=1296100 RepID=A0AAJ8MB45_9TREE